MSDLLSSLTYLSLMLALMTSVEQNEVMLTLKQITVNHFRINIALIHCKVKE